MNGTPVQIRWQAHRGGGAFEMPDNTLSAFRRTWEMGGIPEADIRTSKDGVIVCFHDPTPARTAAVGDGTKDRAIADCTFGEIRSWDVGGKFHQRFAGECVPSLKEVFAEMAGKPDRLLYLDAYRIEPRPLGKLIDRYRVGDQIIFAHNSPAYCAELRTIAQGVRSMLWIGGDTGHKRLTLGEVRAAGFAGLDQVQIHLNERAGDPIWPYDLEAAFLSETLSACADAGIDLEVFPFQFTERSIHSILNIGIRWFATDEPTRFLACAGSWMPGR